MVKEITKIENCPRCKGVAHVFAQGRSWAVACDYKKCGISTSGHTNPAKAVEMWNRIAYYDALARQVEALKKALQSTTALLEGLADARYSNQQVPRLIAEVAAKGRAALAGLEG